ncbi:MAG: hypothetical protein KAT68_03945 [Bacteroidales bacterium]|nr:hypothetical protein [Bacteroidales bacterium]
MREYRYILDNSSKKHLCPACGKKTFVRYINTNTGEYIHDRYGRCDREINCAFHLNPYNDGYPKMIKEEEKSEYSGNWKTIKPVCRLMKEQKPVSFIPVEVLKQSRTEYEKNNFVQWLISLFGIDVTSELISRYHIGTSKYWDGATIFWQIDQYGRIRSGKIMLYSPITGKRIKEPVNYISWVHKALKMPEFNLKQCLFGEHLLKQNPYRPVGIVESEKTAIIASLYLPEFIWMAVGSLSNLNAEKCRSLQGRNVYLFPDLKGFNKWSEKAKELSLLIPKSMFEVSGLLEKYATETDKARGLDIADYLIKQDWQKFLPLHTEQIKYQVEVLPPKPKQIQSEIKREAKKTKFFPQPETLHSVELLGTGKDKHPESREKDINELETFFASMQLPTEPIKLNSWSTITDVSKFIEGHLPIVKANNGNKTFKPYLDRLHELKQYLIRNLN